MTIYDEDGFAIQEYEGKQVRSNFWNQIDPKITGELEKVDGFHTTIDQWHYYVHEVFAPTGSYFIVYKNPNFKRTAWQTDSQKSELEKNYQQSTVKYDLNIPKTITDDKYMQKFTEQAIGKAQLEPHPETRYVKESLLLPKSLLDEYVSIIVIKKNVNIQIPEMYEMIKTVENLSILGIKRNKFSSVSVRDVFGVS